MKDEWITAFPALHYASHFDDVCRLVGHATPGEYGARPSPANTPSPTGASVGPGRAGQRRSARAGARQPAIHVLVIRQDAPRRLCRPYGRKRQVAGRWILMKEAVRRAQEAE